MEVDLFWFLPVKMNLRNAEDPKDPLVSVRICTHSSRRHSTHVAFDKSIRSPSHSLIVKNAEDGQEESVWRNDESYKLEWTLMWHPSALIQRTLQNELLSPTKKREADELNRTMITPSTIQMHSQLGDCVMDVCAVTTFWIGTNHVGLLVLKGCAY